MLASQYKGHNFKRRVSKFGILPSTGRDHTQCTQPTGVWGAYSFRGNGTSHEDLLNKDSEKLFPAWHHSDKVTNVAKHFLLSYGRLLWNKPTLYKQRRAVNFIVLYTDNYTFCHVHLPWGLTRNRRKRNDTHPITLPYRPCHEMVTYSSRYTSRTGYVTRLPPQPLRTSLSKICRYFQRGAPLFRAPHYS